MTDRRICIPLFTPLFNSLRLRKIICRAQATEDFIASSQICQSILMLLTSRSLQWVCRYDIFVKILEDLRKTRRAVGCHDNFCYHERTGQWFLQWICSYFMYTCTHVLCVRCHTSKYDTSSTV